MTLKKAYKFISKNFPDASIWAIRCAPEKQTYPTSIFGTKDSFYKKYKKDRVIRIEYDEEVDINKPIYVIYMGYYVDNSV